MKKRIKVFWTNKSVEATLKVLGIVFLVIAVLILVYLVFAKPKISAQLLVDQESVIVAEKGDKIDVFFLLKNDGIRPARIENVLIYDQNDGELMRMSESFPKHQFTVWPKDEKLIRLSLREPYGKTSAKAVLNIAYRPTVEVTKSNSVDVRWE
ncbi:TPA: hypothetical protein HA265_02870 [Candidatus Woesearchaeota archaeon]|nr:hypothetical protein [Candidatus Woesearchaeota archaeon]